jgi:hypothetical protein
MTRLAASIKEDNSRFCSRLRAILSFIESIKIQYHGQGPLKAKQGALEAIEPETSSIV